MHGKICITTDATGMADYITDGENGFVCGAGNADELADKMNYVLNYSEELKDMRKRARETYEKYFSMENFGDKLEKYLLECIDDYETNSETIKMGG